MTLLTILAASIEGFSLFLEVIKSPVAKVQYTKLWSSLGRVRSAKRRTDLVLFRLQDIDTAIAIGEPYVEGALGLLWLAVLIVVGARQKMKLVGGCLNPSPFQYSELAMSATKSFPFESSRYL